MPPKNLASRIASSTWLEHIEDLMKSTMVYSGKVLNFIEYGQNYTIIIYRFQHSVLPNRSNCGSFLSKRVILSIVSSMPYISNGV